MEQFDGSYHNWFEGRNEKEKEANTFFKADLHRKLTSKKISELDAIFSVQSERKVCNDYTVRFKNSYYQLTAAGTSEERD